METRIAIVGASVGLSMARVAAKAMIRASICSVNTSSIIPDVNKEGLEENPSKEHCDAKRVKLLMANDDDYFFSKEGNKYDPLYRNSFELSVINVHQKK